MEIEKKYLADIKAVENILKQKEFCAENICQYYVKIGKNEERYRYKKGKYYHTIKKEINDLSREEIEKTCTFDEFEKNKFRKVGNLIEKTRYVVPYFNNLKLEIDVYHGKLRGLCVCEIEFKNEEQAKSCIPPEFCLKDVTNNKKYKNQFLAVNGLTEDLNL